MRIRKKSMARIKTKAVVIDTAKMKGDIKSIADSVRDQAAELARQSLQAQVDAINAASTYRREEILSQVKSIASGTVDQPLKNARVVVSKRKSPGKDRVIVYVDHDNGRGENVFNALDAGYEDQVTTGDVTFPAYQGNLIPISDDLGDPDKVKGLIVAGNVRLVRDDSDNVIIHKIGAGVHIKGFEGKKFYKSTAKWVSEQLIKNKIVNSSKRSAIKLSKDDIIISVPDRPSFKG